MTIKDIAQTLGLSVATISKGLNDSTDISAETKQKICDYARSVGYRSRKSMSIHGRIALLGAAESPGEEEAVAAFCRAAEEARYIVVPGQTDIRLNDFLSENRFYGALLLGAERSPVFSQLGEAHFPVVLLDGYFAGNDFVSGVGSDNVEAEAEAVGHLVSLGHRKIVFLGLKQDTVKGAERLAGYILGLARCGEEYRGELVRFGDGTFASGSDAAEELLRSRAEFTGIVCASDGMAQGFIERMRLAGKRIPGDCSVVGYDDSGQTSEQGITTMRQDFTLIGERAFRVLERSMHGSPSQRAVIGCTLVPRGSAFSPQ